jgi:hypothetical protein
MSHNFVLVSEELTETEQGLCDAIFCPVGGRFEDLPTEEKIEFVARVLINNKNLALKTTK